MAKSLFKLSKVKMSFCNWDFAVIAQLTNRIGFTNETHDFKTVNNLPLEQ
jgi:hypothetical protein